MDDLKSLQEIVTGILESDPQSRSSDNYLFLKVCEEIGANNGFDIKTMSVPTFFLNIRNLGLPTLESVGRVRRKIQEEKPELKACEKVARERWKAEKIFREFSKERKNVGSQLCRQD